jgi:hypothetical protein
MVTMTQALTEREFHVGPCTRKIGPRGGITERVETWRRNGATKLWKTRPNEFRVPVKFGMYAHGYIDHDNANVAHVASECPLLATDGEV